jgi:hypothetical protein
MKSFSSTLSGDISINISRHIQMDTEAARRRRLNTIFDIEAI